MIIHNQRVQQTGKPLSAAEKVLIMVHGRGDSARSFIGLSSEVNAPFDEFAILAIQAIQNTWYPYSFLSPIQKNEPQLSLSLSGLSELLDDLTGLGFTSSQIYFLGFSQGACLTLEFCARHAKRYGGIIAFTGGLIGESLERNNYKGNFESTPIFIGASDNDPHVPERRIEDSQVILESMGATVVKKIYPNLGHTINHDELMMAGLILNHKLSPKT